jgi:enoyl-CoA hydratase/carnithine racemase
MAQSISVSLQDRVLTVTLDRADKRNALTHEMYTGVQAVPVPSASCDLLSGAS